MMGEVAFFVLHVVVFCGFCVALFAVTSRVPILRREMKRLARLSRQGPIYLGARRLIRALAHLYLGDDLYDLPKAPTIRCATRSSDRIVVELAKAEPSSAWADDEHEVEAREAAFADDSPWSRVNVDFARRARLDRLEPVTGFVFRARTRNPRAASDWSSEITVVTLDVPTDGGGRGPGYVWRQTVTAVQLEFIVAPTTRAKDVTVEFGIKTLTVAIGGNRVLDAVRLRSKIRPDESVWELSRDTTGLRLTITLEKIDQTFTELDHWPNAVVGHPSIDTRKIPVLIKTSFD